MGLAWRFALHDLRQMDGRRSVALIAFRVSLLLNSMLHLAASSSSGACFVPTSSTGISALSHVGRGRMSEALPRIALRKAESLRNVTWYSEQHK